MQIEGTILTAQYKPTKNDPNKQTFVFSVAPDDGSKHQDIYTNKDELQIQARNSLNKHVTVTYHTFGKDGKSADSIQESEAPTVSPTNTPTPQVMPNQFVTERQKQDSIESQNALTNACNLIIAGFMDKESPLGRDTIALIRARIPSGALQMTEKAPVQADRDTFAEPYVPPAKKQTPKTATEGHRQSEEPMITDRQINALMKITKAENEADLLVKANVFFKPETEIPFLKSISMEDASEWITKLNEAKK
jgi:hypothetical protein